MRNSALIIFRSLEEARLTGFGSWDALAVSAEGD
jgi:hypothetical protein